MSAFNAPIGLPSAQPNGKHHFVGVPEAVDAQGKSSTVAAAGVVPLLAKDGRVFALLQVEDKPVNGGWTPALAVIGGKVDGGKEAGGKATTPDQHWTLTALREANEELGTVQHLTQPLIDRVKAVPPAELPALLGATTVYVPESKYQVLFVPVNPAELQAVHGLPAAYYPVYRGKTSNDIKRGDWSRAARMLALVEVQQCRGGGWRLVDTDLSYLYGGRVHAPKDTWGAKPWMLPLKIELKGALDRWQGPRCPNLAG